MEFQLMCPHDGQVEVGLQDITAVVFRGPELIEVVFECPQCGESIRAGLRVENLLAAVIELAHHAGLAAEAMGVPPTVHEAADVRMPGADPEAEERSAREREGEPYCEYFRRQLERVECVDDLLAELGEDGSDQ